MSGWLAAAVTFFTEGHLSARNKGRQNKMLLYCSIHEKNGFPSILFESCSSIHEPLYVFVMPQLHARPQAAHFLSYSIVLFHPMLRTLAMLCKYACKRIPSAGLSLRYFSWFHYFLSLVANTSLTIPTASKTTSSPRRQVYRLTPSRSSIS